MIQPSYSAGASQLDFQRTLAAYGASTNKPEPMAVAKADPAPPDGSSADYSTRKGTAFQSDYDIPDNIFVNPGAGGVMYTHKGVATGAIQVGMAFNKKDAAEAESSGKTPLSIDVMV